MTLSIFIGEGCDEASYIGPFLIQIIAQTYMQILHFENYTIKKKNYYSVLFITTVRNTSTEGISFGRMVFILPVVFQRMSFFNLYSI